MTHFIAMFVLQGSQGICGSVSSIAVIATQQGRSTVMKKAKPFVAGSVGGALLFLVINICTYDNGLRGTATSTGESATECFDCLKQVGWPFRLYQSGGILHVDEILWIGLIADTLIATLIIIAMGLLTKMFFPIVAVSASRLTHKQDQR